MNFDVLAEISDGTKVIACEGNPAYFIEAPVNSIAFTSFGDVYRKFRDAGTDGWVLLCHEGGPRPVNELEAARERGRTAKLVEPSAEELAAQKMALSEKDGVSLPEAAAQTKKPS